MAGKRQAMGRGLDALIKDGTSAKTAATTKKAPVKAVAAASETGGPREVAVAKIVASPWQPRSVFDSEALTELVESVKVHGVLQPLLVRGVGSKFELIAGERRLRAARAALLKSVPVVVIEATDEKALEIALIENLQREDLNPIERAEAFRRLTEQFHLTHQAIAELVGLDRSSVTNHLRLLELDEPVKSLLRDGSLGLGQGRALLAITNVLARTEMAERAVREGWSTRATERAVHRILRETESTKDIHTAESKTARQAHLSDLDRRLSEHLGTKVRVLPARKKGTGKIMIEFYTAEQFEGLIDRLGFTLD